MVTGKTPNSDLLSKFELLIENYFIQEKTLSNKLPNVGFFVKN